MSTQSYKCPSCGAGIAFDPDTQKFKCEYCLSEYTQEAIDSFYAEKLAREEQKQEQKQAREETTTEEEQAEQEHMAEYVCDSCGAHVVTTETTAATFCYYCHNPVVLVGRLSGEFKPDLVLPFHVSKDSAVASFEEWARKHRYLPSDFASPDQLEKMTGLYLPYWLNDASVSVDFQGSSQKIRTWRVGDYIYTETSVFEHERRGAVVFDDLPAIAFSKFDPDLLRAVTPFDMTEAENFTPSYLSGFFAEQFDMDKNDVAPILEEAAKGYSNTMLYEGLRYTGPITEKYKNLSPALGDWELVLLPTWVLTYEYLGKVYVYAVNGQTGKTYGELPLNRSKLLMHAGLTAAAVLALGLLAGFFLF